MSNNKLTSIAPSLSLGVGSAAMSTSNLSTLAPPAPAVGAAPLSAHTLNFSANTLNTLNTLSNPGQTLNTLSSPTQAVNSLNSPAQTLNALNAQTAIPSSQAFLTSSQVTNLVSLPQNFCIPSQSAQAPVSAANQPTALGVTLGFPVAAAALTSNTLSLNTNTIPLNTSSIPLNASSIPLNANTLPLNAGSQIPQQFVQSLSVGQQPTICASLPQSLSFPLGQTLLGMSNTAAPSGSPFLSTPLNQFTGLSPVIMGGQQSVLQGTLVGNTSAGQGTQIQALGTLNPQSLTFPLSAGPVVTELPLTPQPSQQAAPLCSKSQETTRPCQQDGQQTPAALIAQQETQVPPMSSQQGSQPSADLMKPQQESENPSDPSVPQILLSPPDSDLKVDVPSAEQAGQPLEQSESQDDSQSCPEEESVNEQPSAEVEACVQLDAESAAACGQSLAQSSEEIMPSLVPPSPQPQEPQARPPSVSSLPVQAEEEQQSSMEEQTGCEEPPPSDLGNAEEVRVNESNVAGSGEELLTSEQCSQGDSHLSVENSSDAAAPVEDVKQEAMEDEEELLSHMDTHRTVEPPQPVSGSSPVKVETGREGVDCVAPVSSPQQLVDSTHSPPCLAPGPGPGPGPGPSAGDVCHLLAAVKQEAVEAEEEEDMALPDSTPGSEDSLDSYYRRHSPSPMASLQLTRADTTTITTTTVAAYARPRLDDRERAVDCKQFAAADRMAVDVEESEFVWEDYLQETGALSVPPTAFKHVECSLQSGFAKGMRVEVANKSQPGTYWVAAVVMTCGPLLRLRYEGYDEDGSEDFWCDLTTCEVHPVGWCADNGVALLPPDGLRDKHQDWTAALRDILKTVAAAPSYLLDKTTGTSPIEQLKQGMRLELQDAQRPNQVWLARVMENVGGRLYLRLEGMDSGATDFWAFYLNEYLHPIGWAKQRGYPYVAPTVLSQQGLSESEIQNILQAALREAEEQNLPSDIFQDQLQIGQHDFKCGMKLEAVNPNSGNFIGPATVTEVIDSFYFLVEMDDLEVKEEGKRTRFSCHSATPTIFPIQWTACKGIKLTAPPGWPKPDFSWADYLTHCSAVAAPETCFHLDYEDHEFERGMKLEAVNPDNPNQICAATITKLAAHLMWIHLDSSASIVASHVEHVASHNLFPVGWCESNSYQLRPPRRTGSHAGSARRRVAVVQPEMADSNQREEESEGRTYCPKIYFNHKCFSGPHLSKGRIAELPCFVGPGPLNLVMKEVLSMLISVAYKSSRVLREIQLDGPPNRAMNQQILKAKYKNKSYRAVVEMCRTTSQLEDYCRQVCIKLECCPNLISPHFVGDSCPEHCSRLTKTKYTYYYGKKKRKIGRPPGGHTNLENGPKKPSKRRKRRRLGMVVRKSHPTNGSEQKEEEEGDKTSETSDTPAADSSSSTAMSHLDHKPHSTSATAAASKRLKRKYTHHIPPPSEIRTRGAKLPRYSFERRTHKKILLSPAPSGVAGLRSKSLQSLQLHKSQKFKRTPSPGPSMPQPVSLGTSGASRSLPCTSPLSITCPPITPLSISVSSTHFSLPPCSPLPLDKNPLHWSVSETVDFIKTTDCAHVAKMFREQEIDGQALLLLTLPTVQEHLELKLGPAIKLCHEVERVKRAFYTRYDTAQSTNTF